MQVTRLAVSLFLLSALCLAEKPLITVEVLDSHQENVAGPSVFMLPSYRGGLGMAGTINIPIGYASVKMPDGRTLNIQCVGRRKLNGTVKGCFTLEPGPYQAEIAGNALIIHAHELGGKEHRIKFQVVQSLRPAVSSGVVECDAKGKNCSGH